MSTERKQMKKEVLNRVTKAAEVYVWCVIDGTDTGHYFKTTKSDALHWTKKYIEEFSDLEKLDNCYDLHKVSNILYIN